MKVRNGFVSNSSSSSFVVKYRVNSWVAPEEDHQKVLLTKEQLKLLKKNGFKYTKVNNPYFVDTKIYPWERNLRAFKRWDDIHLGMTVTCNQDDVIYFLLENKIPFVALCHYDQELVVWDGKTEYFYEMPNILEKVSRDNGIVNHDVGETSQYLPAQLCPTVKKIKINEWLDRERSYVSSLV